MTTSWGDGRHADAIIVGAGIIGLATAQAVQKRYPGARVFVIEKETHPGAHQTGHNSGVIHSGIYYRPGSLKAKFCKQGNLALRQFCSEEGIPFKMCGKMIVASSREDLTQLAKLKERGAANGIAARMLSAAEMREIEPHVAGLAGLYVPSAGIVDYKAVVARLAALVVGSGGHILYGARVLRVKGQVAETTAGAVEAKVLVNCAGLYSDRIAEASGADVDAQIVPFRGEYYQLRREKAELVRGLIYPVPNPAFPFLGVHCTRMLDGSIHLGPNAVLALSREGYRKSTISIRDTLETLSFPGFWKLAARYWKEGAREMLRSFSRAAFVRSVQQLVPEITEADIIPSEAGVRAQVLRRNGILEDDFLIVRHGRTVHVCNAPSPAATASLKIGDAVAAAIVDL